MGLLVPTLDETDMEADWLMRETLMEFIQGIIKAQEKYVSNVVQKVIISETLKKLLFTIFRIWQKIKIY